MSWRPGDEKNFHGVLSCRGHDEETSSEIPRDLSSDREERYKHIRSGRCPNQREKCVPCLGLKTVHDTRHLMEEAIGVEVRATVVILRMIVPMGW